VAALFTTDRNRCSLLIVVPAALKTPINGFEAAAFGAFVLTRLRSVRRKISLLMQNHEICYPKLVFSVAKMNFYREKIVPRGRRASSAFSFLRVLFSGLPF